MPIECLSVRDRATGAPVRSEESPRQAKARRRNDRTERRGSSQGRMPEHEGGKRQVVGRIGDEGGGPVEQRPKLPVDEKVERMEVAVGDVTLEQK